MASILDWMRNNESKYVGNSFKPINMMYTSLKAEMDIREKSLKQEPRPDTLDEFLDKSEYNKSEVFDEGFGKEDFKLFTKRWKEENKIE